MREADLPYRLGVASVVPVGTVASENERPIPSPSRASPLSAPPMDMDLTQFRLQGPARKPLEGQVTRELTPEDMARLDEPRGVVASPLQRLSQRHHALARLMAEGVTVSAAAAILGMSPGHISVLRSDPTFRELVQFFEGDVKQRYLDKHEVLGNISMDAALELQERLEDPDRRKKIPEITLVKMVEMGADRTGMGPTVKQEVNVNVNLADRLKEARKRVNERRLTIEGTAVDITPEA